MKYRKLGHTDIDVSVICLGTMTWGVQNTEAEAHRQMDYACEQGVNLIDTAELYPIPPREQLHGITESFIGSWIANQKQKREKIILASKVAGPGEFVRYIRGGPHLSKSQIKKAIQGSLKRLQTDYIDLYQLHWPERKTNFFGQLGYILCEDQEADIIPIQESLEALHELIKEGLVRSIGISNETPWGISEFLRLHREQDLPRVVSIQNPYNLLNRGFEMGLSEIAHREKVGLLAYSPLGFGVLSGKYLDGARPPKARLTLYGKSYQRYTNEWAIKATDAYIQIAKKHGIDPAQMALAFVNSRPFVTSNIIGATNMEQLEANIKSVDLTLSPEIYKEIENIQNRHPNPAP